MALLSLNLPVIGQSSATEDQKTRDALAAIQTDYNGNITDANIAATAGIQASKFASGATGPAQGTFSAYRNAASSLATGSVIAFDAEEFDVSSWHDASGGVNTGRFTPVVAGYYCLNWNVTSATALAADVFWRSSLRKNGVQFKLGQVIWSRATTGATSVGTAVVQANGTDYFDVMIEHGVGAATAIQTGAPYTYFQGHLIGKS
jgi:hypothetical protein